MTVPPGALEHVTDVVYDSITAIYQLGRRDGAAAERDRCVRLAEDCDATYTETTSGPADTIPPTVTVTVTRTVRPFADRLRGDRP